MIRAVADRPDPAVFVLWGNCAQKKLPLIDEERHIVVKGTALHGERLAVVVRPAPPSMGRSAASMAGSERSAAVMPVILNHDSDPGQAFPPRAAEGGQAAARMLPGPEHQHGTAIGRPL
ncbi:hypothetical protein SMICM17S_12836 [Streptomyces microflavus]